MSADSLSAADLAVLSSGLFLILGLATGFWKYRCMIASEDAEAPYYVDVSHRAALMYGFACLVLAEFARLSAWSPTINLIGVVVPVLFFASAVATYVVHGILRDTDNQLKRPHRLGTSQVHSGVISLYLYSLAIGELGGFLILFSGSLGSLIGL